MEYRGNAYVAASCDREDNRKAKQKETVLAQAEEELQKLQGTLVSAKDNNAILERYATERRKEREDIRIHKRII